MLILMISLCTTVIAILLEGPVQRYLKNRPPPVSFARQFRLSRRQTPQAQTVSLIPSYMTSVNLSEPRRRQNCIRAAILLQLVIRRSLTDSPFAQHAEFKLAADSQRFSFLRITAVLRGMQL